MGGVTVKACEVFDDGKRIGVVLSIAGRPRSLAVRIDAEKLLAWAERDLATSATKEEAA